MTKITLSPKVEAFLQKWQTAAATLRETSLPPITEEKQLSQYTTELGRAHREEKGQETYDQNAALIMDYVATHIPKVFIDQLVGQELNGWLGLKATAAQIGYGLKSYCDANINNAFCYLDYDTCVPHATSERIYKKMQWLEWFLTKATEMMSEVNDPDYASIKGFIGDYVNLRLLGDTKQNIPGLTGRITAYAAANNLPRLTVEQLEAEFDAAQVANVNAAPIPTAVNIAPINTSTSEVPGEVKPSIPDGDDETTVIELRTKDPKNPHRFIIVNSRDLPNLCSLYYSGKAEEANEKYESEKITFVDQFDDMHYSFLSAAKAGVTNAIAFLFPTAYEALISETPVSEVKEANEPNAASWTAKSVAKSVVSTAVGIILPNTYEHIASYLEDETPEVKLDCHIISEPVSPVAPPSPVAAPPAPAAPSDKEKLMAELEGYIHYLKTDFISQNIEYKTAVLGSLFNFPASVKLRAAENVLDILKGKPAALSEDEISALKEKTLKGILQKYESSLLLPVEIIDPNTMIHSTARFIQALEKYISKRVNESATTNSTHFHFWSSPLGYDANTKTMAASKMIQLLEGKTSYTYRTRTNENITTQIGFDANEVGALRSGELGDIVKLYEAHCGLPAAFTQAEARGNAASASPRNDA